MSSSPTSCPACGQALEPSSTLERCPACGASLRHEVKRMSLRKFTGLILILILAPLLMLLIPDAAPISAFLLAPALSLAAGILIGVRIGRSPVSKAGVSLLF